jgi:hypothetical protein
MLALLRRDAFCSFFVQRLPIYFAGHGMQRAKFTATPRSREDAEDNDREMDSHPHALVYTIARIEEMLKKAVQYPKQFYKINTND